MRTRILVVLLLAAVAVLLVGPVIAQQDGGGGAERLRALLDKRVDKISDWRDEARHVLLLTLAVGMLGIAAGAIQAFTGRWVKLTTVAVGLIISGLTLVQSEVYRVDRQSLQRAAVRAERIIEDIELVLPQAPDVENTESWPEFAGLITRDLDRIDEIEDQLKGFDLEGPESRAAFHLPDLVRTAEAVEPPGAPEWVTETPHSEHSFLFVGVGVDPSLGRAREMSNDDAMEQAVAYFAVVADRGRGSSGVDADELSRRIVASAKVESTYYAFDRGSSGWQFYTLLRIARESADSAIEFYGVEQMQRVPDSVVQQLEQAERPQISYSKRRLEAQQETLRSVQQMVPSADYKQLEEARTLRRKGDPAAAIELLIDILARHDDLQLVWHNMALALDDLGRFDEALEAYARTAELQQAQGVDDASLFNSYGYLLYRMKRFEEAIPLLERALEIAPDHIVARNNLRAARQALEESG